MTKILYLTLEQLERLMTAIRKHGTIRDRAMFTVAYWRGLRIGEVGMLLRSDLRESEHRLYVRRLKGSISAEYKLTEDESKALAKWVPIRDRAFSSAVDGPLFPSERKTPISPERLHALMKRYSELAGIPPELSHFHVLRHSIATHMVQGRYTMREIQDWLGHRSSNSTDVYASMTNTARDAVSESLERTVRSSPDKPAKGFRK